MLAVLPDTTPDMATGVAERLCLRLRLAVVFPDMRLPLPHLTGSFGVASLMPGGDERSLLAAADAALYRAKHLGRDRVIVAYERDGAIVDPGPESSMEKLLEACPEPRALLLTHIHLDHAGATGTILREHPGITVFVHERGAPHMLNPEKLLASATRLYGDDMDRLWGEFAAVPASNVVVLSGGERIEAGGRMFDVAYTPGHASHHVSYLHEDSGDAYVGDVAGVRIPPYDWVVAPTPPPEIEVETWMDSIHAITAMITT